MIILNQCRIDAEGKNLIVEATVENLNYYKNVYIDSVIVNTNDNYSPNGPIGEPIAQFTSENLQVDTRQDCNSLKTDEECKCGNVYTLQKAGAKHIRLNLSAKDLGLSNLNDNIFFVYIVATGIPTPDCPCTMDNKYTMGVAVNMRPIYNMSIKYIKEMESNCSIPKGFIDMILRIKAFELSLKTGNFPTAFKQWDRLFKNKINVSSNKECGCNGIN